MKQGIKIIAECTLLDQNANYGDINLKNVTLYGEKFLTISEPLIYINSINNITVDECSFKSYTKLGDPNLHILMIDSVDSCQVTDISDKRIRYLNYTNNYQTTETKDWQDSVSLVSIFIRRGGDQIRNIVEIIENITVENAKSNRDFIQIGSYLPSLTLRNFYFKNAVLYYQPTYGVDPTQNSQTLVKHSTAPFNATTNIVNAHFENNTLYQNNAFQADRSTQLFSIRLIQIVFILGSLKPKEQLWKM
ncbi:UNKNOWN [Stylonychia lemnae]|uniref:Uncharacterized protein n=1 Tax=Stylonychia lemnae TaxID=5949 RepID=A0A078AKM4_STYLE|nr:UNKNOWN [Stylonychia lemnae]|eukprot:CDW82436.1 UNKNOWN [Stylonychia lemnae]